MGNNLEGQTALVTGATRGLGRAISLELAKAGAHIIALARTEGALEELDDQIKAVGSSATLTPIDLKNTKSIDALGPSLFPRFDHVDIFVANAATLGPLSPLTHYKDDDWHKIITTNFTANWHLIRTLDPLLARAPKSTVVFVSDALTADNQAYWAPYNAAKAGLKALANSYANENTTTNISVKIFEPGPMATALRRSAYPGEDQSTLPAPERAAEVLFAEIIENQTSG